jgi:hypothetical protein
MIPPNKTQKPSLLMRLGIIGWLAKLDNCKNFTDSFLFNSNHLKSKLLPKLSDRNTPHPLFLAQHFQELLLTNKVNNQASLARIYGITRARVTQIMNLLKLPPVIQNQITQMTPDEQQHFTERALRRIIRLQDPSRRIETFNKLKS